MKHSDSEIMITIPLGHASSTSKLPSIIVSTPTHSRPFEELLEMPHVKQQVEEYLKEHKNEETLIFIEKVKELNKNGETEMLNYQLLIDEFLKRNSKYEINISSPRKKRFIDQVNNQNEEKAKEELLGIYFELLTQLKLEVSSKIDVDLPIEHFLKENSMEEYLNLFEKAGFIKMCDIKETTESDLRKMGIWKLGHLKRIIRKRNEYFGVMGNTVRRSKSFSQVGLHKI
ncbi:hypothetical protein ABK040_012002 [Willaertia magna]